MGTGFLKTIAKYNYFTVQCCPGVSIYMGFRKTYLWRATHLSVNAKEGSVYVLWSGESFLLVLLSQVNCFQRYWKYIKGVHRHTWKPFSSFFHERPLAKICFSSILMVGSVKYIYHVKLFRVRLMQLLHYFRVWCQ